MRRFAKLLDRLVLTPSRNGKLTLLVDYFATTLDPDRGLALAALTGDLDIPSVKPAMLRTLVTERYKITVYRGSDEGELFDLQDDPDERQNRWQDPAFADIKSAMLLRFVQAEIEKEPTRYPRIASA